MKLACVVVLLGCAHVALGLIRSNHVGALNEGSPDFDRRTGMLLRTPNDAPEQWFTQAVDHFDHTNKKTWKQLYFEENAFYKPGGPLFVVIGGEGPLAPSYVGEKFITHEWAQKFNAKIVALEHRFYGKSYPSNVTDVSTLRYLNANQALADLAAFTTFIKKSCPTDCKAVIFGGSYAGNLAAWARTKYPAIFVGAFASSGPVQAQENFPEYFEVVARAVGATCSATLKRAKESIGLSLLTASGRQLLEKTFKTCAPIQDTPKDTKLFLESITDPICGIVQYNKDNRGRPATDIDAMCQKLNEGSDPVAAWANFLLSESQGTCIESSYAKFISDLGANSPGRSWTFQTCTEYGYFQTGDSSDQPFSSSIDLKFFRDICVDLFGVNISSPNTDWINTEFGGRAIKNVASRVFFGDGTIDPWHALAVLPKNDQTVVEMLPNDSATALIAGTAHCADLYAASSQDLPGLTAARQAAVKLISNWLA